MTDLFATRDRRAGRATRGNVNVRSGVRSAGAALGAVLAGLLVAAGPALAEDPVLSLHHSDGDVIELSMSDLTRLGLHRMDTANEFVGDDKVTFEGVLGRDVLALFEAAPDATYRFVASNDYAVEIPAGDFDTWDVLLAMSQDGTPFSARDKGPLWVVYPQSDHPELQDVLYNSRMIWQLVRIEAQ
ncbi:hypothetical protein [Oceanomicrobium pacificus]|uniref:Oxidoreductase molybdopterin-binding domain-containing protein n=1 Tax=Oceanomicrobium pacificus TaxID=2692916 RepID=A0A6B0TXU4_9RHOB|nr:hypothetical protein [Oceanomicrobium pacificus]MXU66112.1 hypothetical protein [Oceanomicrobium pacificus]